MGPSVAKQRLGKNLSPIMNESLVTNYTGHLHVYW